MDSADNDEIAKIRAQEVILREELAGKFLSNGFNRPSEFALGRIATLNHHIQEDILVQDTGGAGRVSTRAPVERLLSALYEVRRAYGECLSVAEVESPTGRLNIARVLTENMEFDPFEVGSEMLAIECFSEDALQRGVVSKKRAPNYVYYEFIERVWSACEPAPRSRAQIVSILFDCQDVLPKSYRVSMRSTVGDRFDAFGARLPRRRAELERFRQELLADTGGVIGLPGGDAKDL